MPNVSSMAITNSIVSRLSAPRSSTSEATRTTTPGSMPRWPLMINTTFVATSGRLRASSGRQGNDNLVSRLVAQYRIPLRDHNSKNARRARRAVLGYGPDGVAGRRSEHIDLVIKASCGCRFARLVFRHPCVDGPLGSRAMLQNRRRVRVRSCVRPRGAVDMTAAQMGSASEPSTRLRFRTAPLDATGYLARRFDRSPPSAVALSPAMPAVQATVAGRYASPLVIMAHTTPRLSGWLIKRKVTTFVGWNVEGRDRLGRGLFAAGRWAGGAIWLRGSIGRIGSCW